MSTTTLSQRLRDLRIGLFPDIETVNAVLDECIAQAEREAQAGEHEKGRDPVSIALARNNAALMEWRGEVKANEPKTLTDDEIDRVTDDLGLGSRGRASFRAGLRYARDHYLKPSQAIGEQTPVAYTMSRDYNALYERLKAGGEAFGYIDYNWHTGSIERVHAHISRNEKNGLAVNGKYKLHLTEGRTQADTVETCQRLNLEWVAPISSEARDKAIEDIRNTDVLPAMNRAMSWEQHDHSVVFSDSRFFDVMARTVAKAVELARSACVDQALSALRSEPGAKP